MESIDNDPTEVESGDEDRNDSLSNLTPEELDALVEKRAAQLASERRAKSAELDGVANAQALNIAAGVTVPVKSGGLPLIRYHSAKLAEVMDEAERILVAQKAQLFVFEGDLVRLEISNYFAEDVVDVRIRSVTTEMLYDHLIREIAWKNLMLKRSVGSRLSRQWNSPASCVNAVIVGRIALSNR